MKETEVFKLLYRAKDPARGRPDTYFAIHKASERQVFVKGPLFEVFNPETFLDVQLIKSEVFGLHTLAYSIYYLNADMKPLEGSYRSLINTVDKYHYFLSFEPIERIHITNKQRKTKEFQRVVAFRELMGIGDTKVNENFMFKDNKIYSVDEDYYFNPFVKISPKSYEIFLELDVNKKLENLILSEKTKDFISRQWPNSLSC